MITLTIPGNPISRVSPKFSRKGTYDPQSHLIHAAKFHVLEQVNHLNYLPFLKDIPIEIELNYYFMVSRGKENLMKWGLLDHIETPDYDNLTKFYTDVVKKIIFTDDRQIHIAHVNKYYSDNPRTQIIIMPKQPSISEKIKEILSMISPEELKEINSSLNLIEDEMEIFDHIDFKKVAIAICELAEKHAENLRKINKKFPGYAKILRDEK
jgi:Holliday junction resolvase RusA-like endonuclease